MMIDKAKKVAREWIEDNKKRLQGRTYESPLPPNAKPPIDQWLKKS
jgi:hypothetical protein